METTKVVAIVLIAVAVPAVSAWILNADRSPAEPAGGPLEGIMPDQDGDRITVLASFYPVYDFARQVGGDKADVRILVPTGIEPHDWDPSIRDIKDMHEADLIIINGAGLEGWVDRVEQTDAGAGRIVDTSLGIAIANGDDDDHLAAEMAKGRDGGNGNSSRSETTANGDGDDRDDDDDDDHRRHGGDDDDDDDDDDDRRIHRHHATTTATTDPHIWLNPIMAKTQVQNIADAMADLDPANAQHYQSNAASYVDRLDLLDRQMRDKLAGCAKDFVVYHGAFSYLANEYGLRQHAIVPSGDSHAEPTPGTIQNAVDLARDMGIDVLFAGGTPDQDGSTRVLEVVAREIGPHVTISILSPIETGHGGSDYVDHMEQNLSNLVEALC